MKIRSSIRTGFSFGITSGIITTLGLITGLYVGTASRLVVIGGVVAIAIADSFSDALGIHLAEESKAMYSTLSIWESTIATFLSKFIFTATFIAPLLFLPLFSAIVIDIVWGLSVLIFLSYYIAKTGGRKPWRVISEHLCIAIIVIILTNFVGQWIKDIF